MTLNTSRSPNSIDPEDSKHFPSALLFSVTAANPAGVTIAGANCTRGVVPVATAVNRGENGRVFQGISDTGSLHVDHGDSISPFSLLRWALSFSPNGFPPIWALSSVSAKGESAPGRKACPAAIHPMTNPAITATGRPGPSVS